mmetsp:Transcript_46461/g.116833  ORF Transcript_46461/g.116833 Transcript_46461/m.116833 type:complete len:234 (-) Transcript_46461:47-748(-)
MHAAEQGHIAENHIGNNLLLSSPLAQASDGYTFTTKKHEALDMDVLRALLDYNIVVAALYVALPQRNPLRGDDAHAVGIVRPTIAQGIVAYSDSQAFQSHGAAVHDDNLVHGRVNYPDRQHPNIHAMLNLQQAVATNLWLRIPDDPICVSWRSYDTRSLNCDIGAVLQMQQSPLRPCKLWAPPVTERAARLTVCTRPSRPRAQLGIPDLERGSEQGAFNSNGHIVQLDLELPW